jgi:3-hydroxyacyl-[acyl-carrier-protein] dehydratase
MILDIHRILQKLPHRYPFLLVDRVLDIEDGARITALKNVTINEPFSRPLSPAGDAWRADARTMAQTSALLMYARSRTAWRRSVTYFVGIDGARFKRPVEPGDQLVMRSELLRTKSGIYKFKASAHVGDELAVEAELMCTMREIG